MLDGGHRSGAERLPVHDRRIELVYSVGSENGALPRVEQRTVLHDPDCRFNCVETAAAALQNLVSGTQGNRQSVDVGFFHHRRHAGAKDRPGTAVDDHYVSRRG